jgi:hypothetical protein
MQDQFAHAALINSGGGEASIRNAAQAALRKNRAAAMGKRHAPRLAPFSAPFHEEKESRGGQGALMRGRKHAAVVALFICKSLIAAGEPFGHGTSIVIVFARRQTNPATESKILVGGGACAGRVAHSELRAEGRQIFRRAVCASRGEHQKAGLAQSGERRFRAPARRGVAASRAGCGARGGAIALHDVNDGIRAVLDVVKM